MLLRPALSAFTPPRAVTPGRQVPNPLETDQGQLPETFFLAARGSIDASVPVRADGQKVK